MSKTSKPAGSDRRSFLKLMGFGGAAAVATIATSQEEAEAATAKTDGLYRETDHVKKVYELFRF